MLFDRKKALNQIMGPSPEKKAEGGEVGVHPHLEALSKEAIDFVHAKDPEGFAHAMKAMHLHLAGEHDPEGYHEEAGFNNKIE